jgi:hypothetical protein
MRVRNKSPGDALCQYCLCNNLNRWTLCGSSGPIRMENFTMKYMTPTLLAAAAIGAVSIASASALPFNAVSPGLGASLVQDVRLVCDRNRQCYETRRTYRAARPHLGPRSDGEYYVEPGYGYAALHYGYYDGPRVGIGIGPFGIGTW